MQNGDEKKKNIALFISMMENPFSRAVCEGAMLAAKELDVNLFILPAGIMDAERTEKESAYYRYQYNMLCSCIELESVDAVLMEHGTIAGSLDETGKKELLEQIEDVPVVLLAGKQKGYSSVCFDNKKGMEKVISHLIEQHGCSKIGFVSGPKENQDAKERLWIYQEVMKKRGLEVSEDWIVYCDFTEFCEEMVENLILRHPDIEAIVFANDQMAIGGYKAFEKLQLVPGKDILVTGFDDSPAAMSVEPHLTTVKADPRELAYCAVWECMNVIKGKNRDYRISPKLIVRESCGCNEQKIIDFIMKNGAEKLTNYFSECYFNNFLSKDEVRQIKWSVETYVDYYLHLVKEDGTLHLDSQEFIEKYEKYSQAYIKGYISWEQFEAFNQILFKCLSCRIKDERSIQHLSQELLIANQELVFFNSNRKMVRRGKAKEYKNSLMNITREILQFSKEKEKRYETMMSIFQRMHFSSAYIFRYEDTIYPFGMESPQIPEEIYLMAYQNKEKIQLFLDNEKKISVSGIFNCESIPKERRFDMIVVPLFSGEEHYGLLMLELEPEHFYYITQIACQVSVTMEIMEILKKQNEIKAELEKSLEKTVEHNKLLNEISRLDPLTEISNRRGFMNQLELMKQDPLNSGKKAVAVYIDMDNLKIINDEFGHEEGDFSLKAIAGMMKEAFRDSDVIGRLGGDEFAAVAIVSQDDFSSVIKERIQNVCKNFNQECDKMYFVNISVGTYEFIIDESVDFEAALAQADADLYQEKCNKKKIVYKVSK